MEELENVFSEIHAELEQLKSTFEKINESLLKTANELAVHNAIISSIKNMDSPDYEIQFTPDFSTDKLN